MKTQAEVRAAMNTPLQDGKTYLNREGRRATIGGATKDYPEWVWSIQGDWYERETGRRVHYRATPAWPATPTGGEHYVSIAESRLDLVAEAPL